jgi:hypothetical protein
MPYSSESWDGPAVQARLSPAAYCQVCLIDANPEGAEKLKSKCKLPVKSQPGGAFNKAAIRNAMGRVFQVRGVGQEVKRAAATRLISLARGAGIAVTSRSLYRLAGVEPPKQGR